MVPNSGLIAGSDQWSRPYPLSVERPATSGGSGTTRHAKLEGGRQTPRPSSLQVAASNRAGRFDRRLTVPPMASPRRILLSPSGGGLPIFGSAFRDTKSRTRSEPFARKGERHLRRSDTEGRPPADPERTCSPMMRPPWFQSCWSGGAGPWNDNPYDGR